MNRFLLFVCVVAVMSVLGCSESVEQSSEVKPSEADVQQDAPKTDAGSDSAKPVEKTMAAGSGDIVFGDQYPEVIAVDASLLEGNSWRVNVTLSSTYDSPQRYADAWRVLDGEDKELGIRILGHDHANEQPFTRSEKIDIPDDTNIVYIEGRDQANGWSGQRFEFVLPAN